MSDRFCHTVATASTGGNTQGDGRSVTIQTISGRSGVKHILLLLALAATVVGGIATDGVAEEKEQKLRFWGDLRGRFEAFRYSEDETGNDKEDRRRIRYRLRLNATAILNAHATAEIQVGTGDTDNRSGNQTLGSPVDFGPNEFDIRRAYLIMYPYSRGKLPGDRGKWAFQFGRVPMPFVWKNTKDIMLWDNDLNPPGASTTFKINAGKNASVFANAGYFVIAEKKAAKDPYLAGFQTGIEGGNEDRVIASIRGSFYHYDNLDSLFVQRGVDGSGGVTSSGGNIQDGLTGSNQGGSMDIVATTVYVKTKKWKMIVWGGYSDNLSAAPSDLFPGVGKESVGWNAGIQGGDKKKTVKVGAGYFYIEANANASQFIDSDLLDGRTNRKGVLIYLSRALFKGVDFNFSGFASDAIKTDPEFSTSVKGSERSRLMFDLVYKF